MERKSELVRVDEVDDGGQRAIFFFFFFVGVLWIFLSAGAEYKYSLLVQTEFFLFLLQL